VCSDTRLTFLLEFRPLLYTLCQCSVSLLQTLSFAVSCQAAALLCAQALASKEKPGCVLHC